MSSKNDLKPLSQGFLNLYELPLMPYNFIQHHPSHGCLTSAWSLDIDLRGLCTHISCEKSPSLLSAIMLMLIKIMNRTSGRYSLDK